MHQVSICLLLILFQIRSFVLIHIVLRGIHFLDVKVFEILLRRGLDLVGALRSLFLLMGLEIRFLTGIGLLEKFFYLRLLVIQDGNVVFDGLDVLLELFDDSRQLILILCIVQVFYTIWLVLLIDSDYLWLSLLTLRSRNILLQNILLSLEFHFILLNFLFQRVYLHFETLVKFFEFRNLLGSFLDLILCILELNELLIVLLTVNLISRLELLDLGLEKVNVGSQFCNQFFELILSDFVSTFFQIDSLTAIVRKTVLLLRSRRLVGVFFDGCISIIRLMRLTVIGRVFWEGT